MENSISAHVASAKRRRSLDGADYFVVAAVTALTLVLVPIGWRLGYRDGTSYVVAWTSLTAVFLTALGVVSSTMPWRGVADAIIRMALGVFALSVLYGLALGVIGRLAPGPFVALALVGFVATRLLPRSLWPPSLAASPTLPPITLGAVAALLAFATAYGLTHAPLTLYDAISYHLYFAGRWLQEGRLSIIATPFSGPSQAYSPANGELFFVWLMAPFHGDLLARIGQLPFGVLAMITLYALARRLGAKPAHALYPAALFLFSRMVLEQSVGANVDLVTAATFLTSLYFGVIAIDSGERCDWMLLGISLGLFFGSKFLALVYTPVFFLLLLARGIRAVRPSRVLDLMPGVVAFGAPWYLRNWIVAGSPLYPASLQIAGVTLAQGAFGRAAMLNSVFHTDDVTLFPTMLAHVFGPTLFVVWIPLAAIGGVMMVRRGWWPNGVIWIVPFLMAPLYWFGFPVNIDSRFLLAAVGPALVPFAFVFRRHRVWNAGVHVAMLAAMTWILIGRHAEIPATLPWFMGGWLALDGLLGANVLRLYIPVTAMMALVWWAVRRTTRWGVPVMAAAIGLSGLGLTLCSGASCPSDYLDTTSPYVRPEFIDAWRWMADNVMHATVAYTGTNLPYPLSGDRLSNVVRYINIDGHPQWRLHDYDRAYRTGRFVPVAPTLASSSGELRTLPSRPGPREDAAVPRYERIEGVRDLWMANLRTFDVTHLFVAGLTAYDIDYVWHNDAGFPIEDEWAKADPGAFRLLYENSRVRIYGVFLPPKAHA